MASAILYQSLVEIGLQDYLKKRGGGNINREDHMLKLDSFAKDLSNDQKEILKGKISKKQNETHTQHNDLIHELSIACAFYNNVNFLSETKNKTPDFLSNGIYVEVKTINNSDIGRKRLDKLDEEPYCEISPAFNQSEVEKIKKEFIDCVGKKFKDHIKTAKKQLNPKGGHIWIVYAIDSPPKFHEKINIDIKNKFDEVIKELLSEFKKSKICVRYIHFGSLREKIASQI